VRHAVPLSSQPTGTIYIKAAIMPPVMSQHARIFTGTQSRYLAEKIALSFGNSLGNCSVTKFSDGELGVQFNESIRGDYVFIVQTTSAPADNLMELLLMCHVQDRVLGRVHLSSFLFLRKLILISMLSGKRKLFIMLHLFWKKETHLYIQLVLFLRRIFNIPNQSVYTKPQGKNKINCWHNQENFGSIFSAVFF